MAIGSFRSRFPFLMFGKWLEENFYLYHIEPWNPLAIKTGMTPFMACVTTKSLPLPLITTPTAEFTLLVPAGPLCHLDLDLK